MDPSTSHPTPATGSNGPAVKAKQRKSPGVRYPIQLKVNISPAMNAALGRASRHWELREGEICRIALKQYLLANDPQYARAMQGGNPNA
jgi:hypothetical protein